MNTTDNLKKVIVGAVLSGGIALAGLTAGVAQASTQPIDPSINTSDFNIPIVECTQCQQTLPGRPTVHPNGGNKGDTSDDTLSGRPTVHPNGGNKGDTGGTLPGRPEVRPNGGNKYDNGDKP
jgi:hypothetical protein